MAQKACSWAASFGIVELAVAVADLLVELGQPMQHPALELGHLRVRQPLGLGEAGEVAQEIAQRVAQAAVGVGDPVQDRLADAQILGVVAADHPQAQDVGTVGLHQVDRRDHVAQGLRHLAAVGVHDEAVGQDGVVGRPAARAAALQQRGVEPAAMLVGALEVERGRPLQLGPPLQHGGVGAAALEPDVQDVVDLLVVVGGVGVAQELLRVAGPPGVGTLVLEGAGDPLDHLGVAQHLARGLVDEHRDRHAPGALARDAPVRPGLDHRAQPVLAARRDEAGLVDGGQRLVAQMVRPIHRDEPLRGGAEDQAAPWSARNAGSCGPACRGRAGCRARPAPRSPARPP